MSGSFSKTKTDFANISVTGSKQEENLLSLSF
jgi:hypothetical protein